MPKLASWIRPKDEPFFCPIIARHPELQLANAARGAVSLDDADGLLLTGGPDIAAEFLKQPIPDPSPIDQDVDAVRDRWEFDAVQKALARGLPILAICKGAQVLNVALGGTLLLDIRGHDLPEMKDADVQVLRTEAAAQHRFECVNSSHHQALNRFGDGLEVEAWSGADGIVEQVRLRDYPFGLGVQYHPERGAIYDGLFEDFFARVKQFAAAPSGVS